MEEKPIFTGRILKAYLNLLNLKTLFQIAFGL